MQCAAPLSPLEQWLKQHCIGRRRRNAPRQMPGCKLSPAELKALWYRLIKEAAFEYRSPTPATLPPEAPIHDNDRS